MRKFCDGASHLHTGRSGTADKERQQFPLQRSIFCCFGFLKGVENAAAGAAEVERAGIGRLELREILLEGLIDMGSCALYDRLEPAEPHPDQFPNTGLS